MMQRVFILESKTNNPNRSLGELQNLIDNGWRIASTCQMNSSQGGSSTRSAEPTCLVILEKPEPSPYK